MWPRFQIVLFLYWAKMTANWLVVSWVQSMGAIFIQTLIADCSCTGRCGVALKCRQLCLAQCYIHIWKYYLNFSDIFSSQFKINVVCSDTPVIMDGQDKSSFRLILLNLIIYWKMRHLDTNQWTSEIWKKKLFFLLCFWYYQCSAADIHNHKRKNF